MFMIDKIGGGDAFSAGLIDSFVGRKESQYIIDFAAASACYKHSIEGDFTAASRENIEQIMNSDGRGRLIR